MSLMRLLFGGKRKSRRRRSRRRTRKRRGRGMGHNCPSGQSWDAVAGKCMPFDSVSGNKVMMGGRRRRRSRRRKSRRRKSRRRKSRRRKSRRRRKRKR